MGIRYAGFGQSNYGDNMGSRLDRNKARRKQRLVSRMKRLCILALLVLFIMGIEIVNQNIVYLDCLDNPNILRWNPKTGQLDFFGVSYILDLSFIKKFIKRPVFVVFLFYIILFICYNWVLETS
ncbi:MAG: hypothetical protein WCZ27_07045 [Tissierellaceae bacterium]